MLTPEKATDCSAARNLLNFSEIDKLYLKPMEKDIVKVEACFRIKSLLRGKIPIFPDSKILHGFTLEKLL